jgi:hypothetical protein
VGTPPAPSSPRLGASLSATHISPRPYHIPAINDSLAGVISDSSTVTTVRPDTLMSARRRSKTFWLPTMAATRRGQQEGVKTRGRKEERYLTLMTQCAHDKAHSLGATRSGHTLLSSPHHFIMLCTSEHLPLWWSITRVGAVKASKEPVGTHTHTTPVQT